MSAALPLTVAGGLDFALPAELEATAPAEARGLARDAVRLLVAAGEAPPVSVRFADLPAHLRPGDLLVVNSSATLPAALEARAGDRILRLHLSSRRPDGRWVVELRVPDGPASLRSDAGRRGLRLSLPEGGEAVLLRLLAGAGTPGAGRLWVAEVALPVSPVTYLSRHGSPIRYGKPGRAWPLSAYQTMFATEPGSAEMPSAGRPFTPAVVRSLAERGVAVASILLHTGVSSQDDGEEPYPEPYTVSAAAAARVNATRDRGGRVVAVGTTVTRALETVADRSRRVRAGAGWTDLVVTPERGVRVVDGLITGWHAPGASHLRLLEAVAGRPLLERAYAAALAEGYLWHEFGDSCLLLPSPR